MSDSISSPGCYLYSSIMPEISGDVKYFSENISKLKTSLEDLDKYKDTLKYGEAFEDYVVDVFRSWGFDARRPKQSFCKQSDYKKLQEDIRIYKQDGSYITVDVKARAHKRLASFDTWAVGGINKYDHREYKSTAVILVDDETYEIFCIPEATKPYWRIENLDEPSYTYPKNKWRPFGTLMKSLEVKGYRTYDYEIWVF